MSDSSSAPTADRLHDAADRVVTALLVDEHGERLASDAEVDTALEDARTELDGYRYADGAEHNEAADVLAEALDAFFKWAGLPEHEREDFTVVLYAVEMARYQYGGESGSEPTK